MSARILTVTVSDTRTAANDTSGRLLREELAAFQLVRHSIVKDDRQAIAELVEAARTLNEVDVIVFTGGTGITAADVTVEALLPIFDKTLDGFGETFRRLSWESVGAKSLLSRAIAGTVGSLLVVALPGSPNAVKLGVRSVLAPMLSHAVDLLHGKTKHSGHHEIPR